MIRCADVFHVVPVTSGCLLARSLLSIPVAQSSCVDGWSVTMAGCTHTITAALETAARGADNLMPHILAAVKSYATLGEIADVFREVFGKHRETVVL